MPPSTSRLFLKEYWRGKYSHWKSQRHAPTDLRCRVANRFTRTVFHMVSGRKICQHRSRLDRGYVMQKLLADIQRNAAKSRRAEPQELGSLLVHVLERLGVTSQPPSITSTSLEAPEADASVSVR